MKQNSKLIILHLHNHAGWLTQRIEVATIEEAIKEGLRKRSSFLEKEYQGRYRIEHDDPNDEHPRFRVVWDDDEPKTFMWGDTRRKGDVWWSDRYELGEENDCEKCGGTGINHYNPFRQCWACGDKELEGKGLGKNDR